MSHYFLNDNNLPSQIKEFNFAINGVSLVFKTDNGVFSKGELDYGTYLLIKNTIDKVSGNVLDLGCGYGPIGLSLASVSDHVTMIDVNKRAVHLTNRNIKDNNITNCEVLENDGLDGISSKFNFIVTNPPIRVGKEKLYSLMEECMNHLEDSGEMFLVIRKEQGANSFIKDMSLKYSVKVIDKSKGFYIISLKFC